MGQVFITFTLTLGAAVAGTLAGGDPGSPPDDRSGAAVTGGTGAQQSGRPGTTAAGQTGTVA